MHLNINLFDAIKDKLDYDDEFYHKVKLLLLYLQIIEGKELISKNEQEGGLTQTESNDYNESVRDETGGAILRISAFKDLFDSSARRNDIAEAYFATLGITGEKEIAFSDESISKSGEFIDIKLWDFDTTLKLKNNVIENFELKDDHTIRLTLYIDEIDVDYQWKTTHNSSISSVICNFISFGACSWSLQDNYGYGYFKLKESYLAFDLLPYMKEGELTFDIEINNEDTTIDVESINIGGNPIADIFSLATSAILSWFDSIGKKQLVKGMSKALENFNLDLLLPWAANLHSIDGPEIEADIGMFGSSGVALAADITDQGPFPQPPIAAPDLSRISQQGFLYSRRYLTAWLFNKIGIQPEEQMLNVNIPEEFGVNLPDPSSYSNDDDSSNNDNNHLDRPPRNVEYKNEVRVARKAPNVVFTQNGVVDKVGVVKLDYKFNISAVKHFQEPVLECHDPLPFPPIFRPGFDPAPEPSPQPPIPNPSPGPGPLYDLINSRSGSIKPPKKIYTGLYEAMQPKISKLINTEKIDTFPAPNASNRSMALSKFNPPDTKTTDTRSYSQGSYLFNRLCDWVYYDRHQEIHTYLKAKVQVTADLRLGFDRLSHPWLPGIRLVVDEDSLMAGLRDLDTHEPFDALETNDLKEAIKGYCIHNSKQILRKAFQAQTLDIEEHRLLLPEITELIIPDAVSEEIRKLIRFTQSGQHEDLSYEVLNDQYLYWSFELKETLTDHIKNHS